jgi:hypothetical protein
MPVRWFGRATLYMESILMALQPLSVGALPIPNPLQEKSMRLELWTFAAAAVLVAGIAGPASAQNGPGGSYLATCRNIQTSGSALTAECRDSSGHYHISSMAFTQCRGDIGNNNGTLFCNAPNNRGGNGGNSFASGGPVSGSFEATCRNIRTSGDVITAQCRDPSGHYHDTRMRIGQCQGDIGNDNGQLFCNEGAPGRRYGN